MIRCTMETENDVFMKIYKELPEIEDQLKADLFVDVVSGTNFLQTLQHNMGKSEDRLNFAYVGIKLN